MKVKNIWICIIFIVTLLLNVLNSDEYDKLKKTSKKLIVQSDLPEEFGSQTLKLINDFIQKTQNLDYEIVMFFDYVTGEKLKIAFGKSNNVKIKFDKEEFKNKHVASIHNHLKSSYSAPSFKNFSILLRDFEDYELVASAKELWIFKAKCVNPLLNIVLKEHALHILTTSQEYCENNYDDDEAYEICDIMYGVTLSNYINDKNIDDIQLTKKEYKHE